MRPASQPLQAKIAKNECIQQVLKNDKHVAVGIGLPVADRALEPVRPVDGKEEQWGISPKIQRIRY